jgi:hypothetical protein
MNGEYLTTWYPAKGANIHYHLCRKEDGDVMTMLCGKRGKHYIEAQVNPDATAWMCKTCLKIRRKVQEGEGL